MNIHLHPVAPASCALGNTFLLARSGRLHTACPNPHAPKRTSALLQETAKSTTSGRAPDANAKQTLSMASAICGASSALSNPCLGYAQQLQ